MEDHEFTWVSDAEMQSNLLDLMLYMEALPFALMRCKAELSTGSEDPKGPDQ